jgi:hypothetical protein
MKISVVSAFVAAQCLAAPAFAADLPDGPHYAGPSRVGGFAGARLRVAIGGRHGGEVRAGLALAPVRRTPGEAKLSFGEGLEFGIAGRERPALRVAGYRLAPGGAVGRDGQRLGVSTVGAVAIGAGVVVVGAIVIALAIRSGE